ncbi:MAG: AbrB/MazE/SpoVT family DNA-binding domain-containing protein [Thaumarchaeota archaeon]|nr:AbrB/MazE/SpoVT family DNA-binding domain-containing protein [Nitrososphaerota archaeon]
MGRQIGEMQFTKASSKGQVVIPTRIRKRLDIKEGSIFAVAADRDVIILKKIDPDLSAADLKSMRLVEEAWKDVEEGRYGVLSKEAFFKELKEW